MQKRRGVIIDAIIVDPPIVFPGDTALITIHAHSDVDGPLQYEVTASDGFIEPTDKANVFLWRIPETEPDPESMGVDGPYLIRTGVKVVAH